MEREFFGSERPIESEAAARQKLNTDLIYGIVGSVALAAAALAAFVLFVLTWAH
jgi:hypothetical protein